MIRCLNGASQGERDASNVSLRSYVCTLNERIAGVLSNGIALKLRRAEERFIP